jgi:hypothetical protein
MLPWLTSYCFHLLQMKAHDETNKTSQARKDYCCIAMQILLVSFTPKKPISSMCSDPCFIHS